MALQCRVVLNENNEIDYVKTEDGQRSQLFDSLAETLGGDKNSALGFYALTESEDFKTIQKNERLSQTKKQESNRGGEIATRATNFLRSKGGTNEKNSSWRQKQELEVFAKNNDYWYDNYKGLGEYIGKGMESLVFLSKDGEKVFKVNDLEFYDTPLNYLNTINEHNKLFPEAPYKVIGFTTRKDTSNFSFVLEQPFIQAERGATQEEVNKELEKLGFSAVGEAESYKKDNIEILDLHEGNVVVDSEGNIFFIDPVIFVTEEEKSVPAYSIAKIYKDRLTKEKQNNPSQYWSVDIPSDEVIEDAAKNGRIVDVNGGMGIVTEDGNMIGMFKYDKNAKNTAQAVQEARIQKGGVKLDNYDGYLTKLYQKNGFRVAARLPFNKEFAPEDWSEEVSGTPDVVFMVYDPQNKLKIEEKTFEDYDEASNYRDSFITTTLSILEETGLADNVFQLSTQEIENKLIELGVEVSVAKQVAQSGGYYSNATAAFSNLKDKNVKNVQGWMKALTDVQKNGGIKNVNQELEWIGLEDYLNNYVKENNPKAGNIPSSVVEDYIKSNQIEIVDVTKGDNNYEERKQREFLEQQQSIALEEGDYEAADYYERQIERLEDTADTSNLQTKYSGYQLKGGENYREVLLTMPSKEGKNPLHTKRDELSKQYREAFDSGNYDLANEIDNQISDITKQLKAENSLNTTGEKAQYKSSHWDEANILAHVRLNEKTLPDGRKVLILNEIQSDWQSQGRKGGFNTQEVEEKTNSLKTNLNKAKQDLEEIEKELDLQYNSKKENNESKGDLRKRDKDFNVLASKYNPAILKVDDLETELNRHLVDNRNSVPNMPYANTDQYIGLVMRKTMQMASQEGYDGIAFATGQQSADMYSLSQQVDKIDINPQGDVKAVYISMKNNADDTVFINQEGIITESASGAYNGKQAEEVLGKDLTKKILETTEETTLEGEGLEFGGEGMKTFYDKIVPKVVQKEAQRFDKNAKLETVDFKIDQSIKAEPQYDIDGNIVRWKASKEGEDLIAVARTEQEAIEKYKEMFPSLVKDKLSLGVQPYLPLTQSIKDSVSQGIPQFQKSGITPITNGFIHNNDVYLNKDTATEETEIHEFNHLYNNWLKQNRPEVYKKGLSLIKKELKSKNSEIKEVIDFVKTNQPNLKGDTLLEEILTELVGRKGLELLIEQKDKTKSSGIINWLSEVWQSIKDMLGLSSYTDEQILSMNLQDFANASAIDLLRGERIDSERNGKQNTEFTDETSLTKPRPLVEPSVEDVIQYANSTEEELSPEQIIDLQDVIMSLGVDNSKEAEKKLKEALETKGFIRFNKRQMLNSGAFNKYEVKQILNSKEKQDQVEQSYRALKNSPTIEVEYPKDSVNRESKINSFGKQSVINPLLPIENEGVEVKTVTKEGVLENKTTGTDTEAILNNTYIGEENVKLSENLFFIAKTFSPEVWENKKDAIFKVVKQIKEYAKDSGIDLKNIEEKVYTKPREEIINFFESLEDFLQKGDATEFASLYNEMFELNKPVKESIRTDNKFDVYMDEDVSEYEAFTKHNLVKKSPTVYRKIKGDLSLDEAYSIIAQNESISEEQLRKEVRENPLEVSDYEVDVEELEKMQLYKRYFNFPKNIPSIKITNQKKSFIRKANKWLLKSGNPYYKITKNGLELVSQDEITRSRAELTLPEYLKQEEKEEVIVEDLNKERRLKALTNPSSVQKVKGEFLYLEPEVVAIKNEVESMVRTPRGVFEYMYGQGNVGFYGKITSEERPLSNMNYKQYTYLENSPELFQKAKNYYSKAELYEINRDNFECS